MRQPYYTLATLQASNSVGFLMKRCGVLMSQLAEQRSHIFVVATANDITTLPPELIRKGRFDEIFFVDLPGLAARMRCQVVLK